MKGGHKEGTQKQKVRKIHFAAMMDIRHIKSTSTSWRMFVRTISSVDISTSTSRECSQEQSQVWKLPSPDEGAVHELPEKIDEAGK